MTAPRYKLAVALTAAALLVVAAPGASGSSGMTLRHPEARHVTNRVVNEYLEPLLSPTEQRLPRKVWGCRVRADHGACSLRATGPIVTCQGRIKIVELPDEYRVWAARLRCD